MNSLKNKFDDYREEPQYAGWQQLLKRLNAEMPVERKRKYLVWFIPIFIIVTGATWYIISTNIQSPVTIIAKYERQPEVKSITSKTSPNTNISPMQLVEKKEMGQTPNTKTNTASLPGIPLSSQPISPDNHPLPSETAPVTTSAETSTETTSSDTSKQDITGVITVVPINKIENKHHPLTIPENTVQPVDTTVLTTTASVKPNTKNESKFVLEIYYAPGVSNIILRDPLVHFLNSKTVESNKNLRNSINKMGFSYTTGFGLKMNMAQDFRLKTGYYFTQVSQVMYYKVEAAQCNCGQVVYLSQLDPKLTEAINTGDTISKGNTNSFTNRYSLREIPLIIEYARPTLKYHNVNYLLNIGFSYMYMSGIDAQIPDADNVGFISSSFNKTANVSIFPSYHDAFNIIAGGGLLLKAKRNVEYMLAPQFKMAVTSLSKNNRWLREYPWQMQVAFGIGKRF